MGGGCLTSFFITAMNGTSRPISGWLSDSLGREELLFVAFIIEGLGFLFLWLWGANYTAFVIVTGMLFFAYGEIFSIYPASLADTFGRRYMASIYGLLYTAKGVGSLIIPITDIMWEIEGSWKPTIILCFALSFAAAFLIVAVVRPMKRAHIMRIREKHGALEMDEEEEAEENVYH